MWVLVTELGSSGRPASVLHCSANSPAPSITFSWVWGLNSDHQACKASVFMLQVISPVPIKHILHSSNYGTAQLGTSYYNLEGIRVLAICLTATPLPQGVHSCPVHHCLGQVMTHQMGNSQSMADQSMEWAFYRTLAAFHSVEFST